MSESALKSAAADAETPRWEEDALGFLIAPVTPKDFLDNHYEQKALIGIRDEPERYADLLTLESLDHFLNSADLREGMVDLTNHHNRIERDSYVSEDGRVNRAVLADEYLRGSTIILPQFHELVFNLGEFCRALEEVFTCHVQTNIYLTPRSIDGTANQGFPPHYDNHDVFVMQISGAKAWRIYGTPVATPFRGERFEIGQHEAGEPTQTFTLKAGDCLYMPRGVMHDAENSGEEPSLHITVGLITKTWADLLLESISELALEAPEFRRSLPAGFALRDFDREEARDYFDRLKTLIAEKASMDGAFDLLADNFLRGRRPNVGGVIAAAGAAAGQRPLPPPPLRALERRRRRRQVDPDRPGRRPRIQRRGRRRARRRPLRPAVHRRRPQMREARRPHPNALGRRLSGADLAGPRRAAMSPDRVDQRKIPGLAGEPLAFGAIAEPDHLADPLAERDAAGLIAARRLGGGGLRRARGLLLGADRIAVGAAPPGPQALEAAAAGAGGCGAGALCPSASEGDSSSGQRRPKRSEEAGITGAPVKPFG